MTGKLTKAQIRLDGKKTSSPNKAARLITPQLSNVVTNRKFLHIGLVEANIIKSRHQRGCPGSEPMYGLI